MEAISHAGTVLGVLATDGVVLAAEKKVTGKLLDLSEAKAGGYGGSGEKIFLLNSNVVAGVAGITADANSLVNYARSAAQQHLLRYNEDIPVELLAQRLCDLKQGYTQFGFTTIWRVSFVRWVRPTLSIPALPLGSIGQLFRLEGYLCRCKQRYRTEFIETGVQGRHHGGRGYWLSDADHEQDDGQYNSRQRKA